MIDSTEPAGMESSPDVLRISTDEIAAVVPRPTRPQFDFGKRGSEYHQPNTSRQLALVALVVAMLGVVLVGCLLGPIAIVLATLALVNAERHACPTRVAYAAFGLGVVEFVGWSIALWLLLSAHSGGRGEPSMPVARTSAAPLRVGDAPPHILRALKANLRLICHDSSGMRQGAGIVVGSGATGCLVLTNRHVVDCVEHEQGGLVANLVGGPELLAAVEWSAPGGIDLALVRVQGLVGSETIPLIPQRPQIGDAIFTAGNPLGYEASYAVGTLSAIRQAHFGSRPMRVYQIQSGVNPGSSGGGMYAANGELLGVNTWVTGQQIGAGIGFALAVDDIIDILRQSTPLWQEIESSSLKQKDSRP